MSDVINNQIEDASFGGVLLIDVENCPAHLDDLPGNIEHYARIVLCYAQSVAKVPLGWLTSLAPAITSGRLNIVKMDKPGKNSADFGICFLAGALMQELPRETHFTIVSNDSDLDYTIQLLKKHGRSAERKGTQKQETKVLLAQETLLSSPHTPSPTALYCTHLVTYSKNRPSKVDTLLNSIKNKFKDSSSSCDVVYNKLLKSGAIKVADKKVSYNDARVRELANSTDND